MATRVVGHVGRAGSNAVEIISLDDATSDATSSSVALDGAPYILVDAEQVARADLTVELSTDDTRWTQAGATLLATGETFGRIDAAGQYVVEATGYSHARVSTTYRNSGIITASIKKVQAAPKPHSSAFTSYQPSRPKPLRPTSTLVRNANCGAPRVASHLTSGVVWGFAGQKVRKSTDSGATFSSVSSDAGAVVQSVFPIESGTAGEVLVFLADGTVQQWDEGTDTFTEVFDTGSSDRAASSTIQSVQVMGSLVIFSEYGSNSATDNPRQVHMSDSYGDSGTWETIFNGVLNANAPNANNWHTHGAIYDPYRDVVWVVNGDTRLNSNVWWCRFGEWGNGDVGNWNKVYDNGDCPNQFTTVYALPNCVMFGSDNHHTGYWRWDAPAAGIESLDEVVIVPALVRDREFSGSVEPIATSACVTYGDNAALYFGFMEERDDVIARSIVYGTADGHNFYPLWTAPEEADQSSNTYVGISGVDGPGVDSEIVVGWTHRPGAQATPTNFVSFPEPDWVSAS